MSRMMRRLLIGVSLALVLGLLTAAVAFALQTAQTAPGPIQQKRQQQQTQTQQLTPQQQARAKRIQERIGLVISRFNALKERHIATYQRIKARVQQIVTTLSARGYDTSRLAQDLQTFDSKVVKAGQDYVTFIGYMTTAQQYAPYESQGQFLAAIQSARQQLRVFRSDLLDARNYYWTVIRPDVVALKAQKPATQPAAPTTPNTTP